MPRMFRIGEALVFENLFIVFFWILQLLIHNFNITYAMLKSLVVASSFAYSEEDAMVVKFNTTSAVLVSLVEASSFAYPIEDAMDKEIDVTYTTSIFLPQNQHIVIAVVVVARRDDLLAR